MIKITTEDLEYIKTVSATKDIDPYALLAVIEVESAGKIYADGVPGNMPVIRWEGHYFDRLVPAEKREEARQLGLASPQAGTIRNPSSQAKRYEILEKAKLIDPEAAYSSISIGVGQVMGSHAKSLGYRSAVTMFNAAAKGFTGQVDLILKFIVKNNLIDELQRKDWSAFARSYNGPAYKQNRYHIKMQQAYDSYVGKESVVVADAPGSANMLRLGSEGARVREIQTLLGRAGFPVKVDGDFGDATKVAVEKFQTSKKLDVDGVVGPQTMDALLKYKTDPNEKLGEAKPADLPGVQGGGITAAAGVGLLAIISAVFDKIPLWVTVGGVVVIALGVSWALDAWNKSKRTYEGTK